LNTVKGYYQILYDTLIGFELPPFRKTPTRKAVATPKFYFFDLGVANELLGRFEIERHGDLFGKSLEHLVFTELKAACEYLESDKPLSYWRSLSQFEVDFLRDVLQSPDGFEIFKYFHAWQRGHAGKGRHAAGHFFALMQDVVLVIPKQPDQQHSGCRRHSSAARQQGRELPPPRACERRRFATFVLHQPEHPGREIRGKRDIRQLPKQTVEVHLLFPNRLRFGVLRKMAQQSRLFLRGQLAFEPRYEQFAVF
jgi:hypothetical protein